jgi:hypothetical protein
MTDWSRVEKLRAKGVEWGEIAEDERVGFQADKGTNPGRALKTLYYSRRSRRGGKGGSATRADGGRALARPSLSSFRSKRGLILTVLVAIALVGSLLAFFFIVNPMAPGGNIVTYCGGEGSAAHYHSLLVINVNGAQQEVPSDIGFNCPGGGLHGLHTHDGSGILHAELPPSISLNPPPTLGDFFTIWGQPLTSSHVWSFSGGVTATVHDMDTGRTTDYSSNPSSIPLRVPAGGPTWNADPIPPGLIFNGQYGGGSSGGGFGGEIIWLNVSGAGAMTAMTTCDCATMAPCASRSPREAFPSRQAGASKSQGLCSGGPAFLQPTSAPSPSIMRGAGGPPEQDLSRTVKSR